MHTNIICKSIEMKTGNMGCSIKAEVKMKNLSPS